LPASNLHGIVIVKSEDRSGKHVRQTFVDLLERVGDGVHVDFVGHGHRTDDQPKREADREKEDRPPRKPRA
jgi:hypothetical protein